MGVHLPMTLLLMVYVTLASAQTQCIVNVPQCKCYFSGRNNIDCRRLTLQSLPALIPTDLIKNVTMELLDLDGSTIDTIPDNVFSAVRFKSLRCRKCDNLRVISPGAFAGLEYTLETVEVTKTKHTVHFPPWTALKTIATLRSLTLKGYLIPKLHDPASFINMTSLSVLKLTLCQIQTISRDAITPITSLTELVLSDNQFTAIPLSAIRQLTKLKVLNLDRNQIKTISQFIFSKNTALETISLSGNNLNTIYDNWTDGIQKSLRTLHLQSNSIDPVTLDKISHLERISEINLEQNKLYTIRSTAFQGLPNLKTLKLGRNIIQTLSANTFQNLRSVTNLNLYKNHIKAIGSSSFSTMPHLETVDLSEQSNTNLRISPDAFTGTNISSLHLSASKIDLPYSYEAINNLYTLKRLEIKSSEIVTVPDFVFKDLSQLEELYLDKNNIVNITEETVYGLKHSLIKLSLGSNQIETINECVLRNFTNLSSIELLDNPLNCDCRLKWLRQWIDIDVDMIVLIQWRCSTGKLFITMDANQFICTNNYTSVQCEEISPPTTTTTTTPTTTTTTAPTTTTLSVELTELQTNVSHENLTVKWTISSTQYVKHYTVSYQLVSGGAVKTSEILGSSDESYIITGLEQYTDYNVCLNVYFTNVRPNRETCRNLKTKLKPVIVVMSKDKVTTTSVLLVWRVNDDEYVNYYNVTYEMLSGAHTKTFKRIHSAERQRNLDRLQENTRYEICMVVYLKHRPAMGKQCISVSTLDGSQMTTSSNTHQADRKKTLETVAIVGGVIAGILLIVLVFAIVFLILRKKKSWGDDKHVYENDVVRAQAFSRNDQPREKYDSKRYRKNKKASSRDVNEIKRIQHVSPDENNLSRVSAGSYQFLNEGDDRDNGVGGIVNPVATQSNSTDRNSFYPMEHTETHI